MHIQVASYNIDPHHTSNIMATLHEKFHKFMNEMVLVVVIQDFISQDKAHSLMRAVIVVVAVVHHHAFRFRTSWLHSSRSSATVSTVS